MKKLLICSNILLPGSKRPLPPPSLNRSSHSFLVSAACSLIAVEGVQKSISRMGAGRYGSGSWQNPSALAKGWARGLRESPRLSGASQPRTNNRPQEMGLKCGAQALALKLGADRQGTEEAQNTYLKFNDVCISLVLIRRSCRLESSCIQS